MNYRLQLPDGPFNTIVADPPWQLKTKGVRRKLHYDRMSLEEIKAIPISSVATPDALLWLWTTNAHLPEALEVVREWGFTYKSLVTWYKDRMGTGWWIRSQTEHLILAARSTKLRRNPGSWRSIITAPYRGHSVKPTEAYQLIQALSPEPRLELFAKKERDGFTTLISDAADATHGD